MSNQIELRPMTEADTENIVRWRNAERVRENFIYQKIITEEEHKNWIKNMIDAKKAVQFIIFLDFQKEAFHMNGVKNRASKSDAMEHKSMDNQDIGSVFFRDIDLNHHKAEYGIFLSEEFIGRGIGTQVAKLAIRYGFETMNLHKITLRAFADNIGAIRSYEKAGFVKEAYLKEEVLIKNEYKDIILMGIINN